MLKKAGRKAELRKRCMSACMQLADQADRSLKIESAFLALPEYKSVSSVAVYFSISGEVQTDSIVQVLMQQKRKVFAPVCIENTLEFFRIEDAFRDLAVGKFGIREIREELRNLPDRSCEISQLDIILVPGIAFDKDGNRLGRGKGYYDRFLKSLPQRTLKIGLCFDIQLLNQPLETESHDIPMDIVVTESEIIRRS